MNEKPTIKTAQPKTLQKFSPRHRRVWPLQFLAILGGVLAGLGVLIYSALADDPPVLTIAPVGTNQFLISITNASSSETYELYHVPVLEDAAYPWTLSATGALGQSNFTVTIGIEKTGFWRAAVGTDWDGDTVLNWMDAAPNDAGIGILSVTIDSPTNGFNFN